MSKFYDLTKLKWKAIHDDGTIIEQGPRDESGITQYDKINRDRLVSFELYYNGKKKHVFFTKGKTLVSRLKTRRSDKVNVWEGTVKNVGISRVFIVCLLIPPKNSEYICKVKYHPQEPEQVYAIDPDESSVFYFFEDGSSEERTRFFNTSPYSPLHLRDEELNHLKSL